MSYFYVNSCHDSVMLTCLYLNPIPNLKPTAEDGRRIERGKTENYFSLRILNQIFSFWNQISCFSFKQKILPLSKLRLLINESFAKQNKESEEFCNWIKSGWSNLGKYLVNGPGSQAKSDPQWIFFEIFQTCHKIFVKILL